MTHKQILMELRKLAPHKRLEIIETALHLTRRELRHGGPPKGLLPAYAKGGELIAFTALDSHCETPGGSFLV
jgi:hypothetical protein